MRILVVQETDWIERNPILHHKMLESLALAGDEVLVLDYDILWRRKGRRPVVQGRREIHDSVKFFAGSGLVVVRPAMLRMPGLARPTWLVMTTIELLKAFRRFKPDVVVAYGISNALVARAFAILFRVPFVFHSLDVLHALAEPSFLAPVARIVEHTVLRSADTVIVVHRALLDYLHALGVRRSRTVLIMNGFSLREPIPTCSIQLRRQLSIPDDVVMILFVGWMYTHSGLREVSRRLVEEDRFGRYRLVVAGDGDLLAELTALSRKSVHGDRLILLGKLPVSQIPDLIGAADVCLFSAVPTLALKHVVPSKVDEYLELLRPVVATRLPGMLRELKDVESIIWIDAPDDALENLDTTLGGQSDARSFLRDLGRSARHYGEDRETWAIVTARFREALADSRARYRGRHVELQAVGRQD